MFIRLSFRTYHQQHKNEDISELSTRVTLMGDADDPWNIGGIVIRLQHNEKVRENLLRDRIRLTFS